MNTTQNSDDAIELVQVGNELLPVPPKEKTRRSPCELDQKYVAEYLAAPHRGRANAYRAASGSSTKFARQRAAEIHARVAGQINEALEDKILGIGSFALDTLIHLAEHGETDGVRGSAASKLLDASLKIAPPNIKANNTRTKAEVLAQIKATRERLAEIGVET